MLHNHIIIIHSRRAQHNYTAPNLSVAEKRQTLCRTALCCMFKLVLTLRTGRVSCMTPNISWIRVKLNFLMVICTITLPWGWPHSFLDHVILVCNMTFGAISLKYLPCLMAEDCFEQESSSFCSNLDFPLAARCIIPCHTCDLTQRGKQGVSEIVSISSCILPQSPLIQTPPWQQKQRRDSAAWFSVLLSSGEHPEAADCLTQQGYLSPFLKVPAML